MRKYCAIVLITLALVAWPVAGHSQSAHPIYANVDVPAPEGGFAEVEAGSLYLAGWSLDCDTGQKPPAVIVVFVRLTVTPPGQSSTFVPTDMQLVDVARPDVADVYRSLCPSVTQLTGYHLYMTQPPPGYWQMHIVWANYSGGSSTQSMIVDIE